MYVCHFYRCVSYWQMPHTLRWTSRTYFTYNHALSVRFATIVLVTERSFTNKYDITRIHKVPMYNSTMIIRCVYVCREIPCITMYIAGHGWGIICVSKWWVGSVKINKTPEFTYFNEANRPYRQIKVSSSPQIIYKCTKLTEKSTQTQKCLPLWPAVLTH